MSAPVSSLSALADSTTLEDVLRVYLDAYNPCNCGDAACPGNSWEAEQLAQLLVSRGLAVAK